MNVFVTAIPGPRRQVEVQPGATVAATVAAAGVTIVPNNTEIRLNSMPVQGNELVNAGDEIFVVQKVKGNEIV